MSVVCRAFVLLATGGAIIGCNKEAPPAAEEPRAPTVPATEPATQAAGPTDAVPAAPAAAAATARISEASFDVALEPGGTYQVGQEGVVTIVLDAKPPYKVNQEYPYKWKFKEAAGIKARAPVVGKDAAKLETQRVTMPIAFVPEAPGEHSVAGQFAFSVCTDENCLVEKRDLALVVSVK